ncbi:Ser-tRNA(Ala) deacylase [Vibrio astriarenae]|nr:Ser-tRNA(Ala) deacylase [Vibrio sp. C7]
MAKSTYLSNTYLDELTVHITKVIEMDDSIAIYCDETIFYPKGGGQPCDIGVIVIDGFEHQVYHVESTKEGIAHILEAHPYLPTSTNKQCIQRIDIQRRLLNAKSHTAGHLISHIFEDLDCNLSPAKGCHYPGNSCIELIGYVKTNDNFSIDLINDQIDALVEKNPIDIHVLDLDLAQVQSLRPY